ncbi:MAG: hypothetical protein HY231_07300 [Acidobacteria bacterium]|nr:hypothetical protein [Acidobacteriota bacterium]
MENLNRDLWPNDIGVVNDISTPVGILKEQAALLGQKTKNLVEGEISDAGIDNNFNYKFYLIAPALKHYKYHLFSVHYPIDIYPLKISWEGDPIIAKSEEEFTKALQQIFSNDKTKKVIRVLLAQSQ